MAGAACTAVLAESSRYQLPPQPVIDMVDAPAIPQTVLAPSNDWLMMLERPSLPPLSEVAQPMLGLAGVRVNPRNNDGNRASAATAIRLVRIADRAEKLVAGIPAGVRIGDLQWSPDGKRIAFTVARETQVELMVAEVTNGAQARRLTDRALNGMLGRPFVWANDSASLLVNLVPAQRGSPPRAPAVPQGPNAQENLGRKNALRTFQDLLKSPHEEALFDHYATSELAQVKLDGTVKPVATGIIRAVQPSPNGEFVLVTFVKRPYSYALPAARFPSRTEVRDAREPDAGRVVKVLAETAAAEEDEIDPDQARKGPRNFAWRADQPATVTWMQAVEGRRNNLGDQLIAYAAPFDGEPQVLARVDLRLSAVYWGRDDFAWLVEGQQRTRRTVAWRIFPADPARSPVKLFDRSSEDRYGDPGTPLMETNRFGARTINFTPDGGALYLIGRGASAEGERPFIDRFDIESREAKRLYRSEPPFFEQPMALFDATAQPKLLLQRESVTEAPNVFLRDLTSGAMQPVTRYATPKNPIANATKELIRYKRKDGVELSATLYLPPGYRKGDEPLPLLMWAYPREFRSAEAAGQVSGSPYRYVRPAFSGPLPFLTQGYAVLDNPTMPIVGEGRTEPNDTYLPQLIASAEAAVDEVVRRGVTERGRIAVGGHSYGAFMVANLLAHTKLFAAGIAESGAYNRTLTPFGFQSEDRHYWKAREVYGAMSPFNFADQIKAPLLLIHGENDSNPGTFPMQSERLYQALRGLGGTARLVMLPHEDHGYRARESVLHRLWESVRWLDKYVKNGK
ncbi:MAG: S9 family peptidase [Betaproteobacteria bacterium]|nr:S9 family peptidase [Betaproteobacteria bacterium]